MKLIFLNVFSVISFLQSIYCCEVYRFVQSEESRALEGHVIKTISHLFVNLCWSDCVWLPWCFSINVRQTSEGMFECELNNSSKKANSHKMVTREGWSYHEMANVSLPIRDIYDYKRKEDLGNGWLRYGDAALKLFTEKKTWSDARSHCQSLGGDLLSITSSHENDFVSEVFLHKLNLTYVRKDYPDFGTSSQVWKLNQTHSTVKLKGTSGDVFYKAVDGETALYFTGRQGYAHIPAVNVNPEGFTISFWMKILSDSTAGNWIHCLGLLNQPLYLSSPARIIDFFYLSGSTIIFNMQGQQLLHELIFEYDTWTHVAVSWNKSTGLCHYVINGTKYVTWSGSVPITGKENILLGVKHNAALSGSETMHGYLKDIMVINKTLDVNKIQTITFWNEHGAWMGLNDQAGTDRFTWSDGTPVGQFMPFPGYQPKPALSGRKCVIVGSHGNWFDKLCNYEYPFICEKRLND